MAEHVFFRIGETCSCVTRSLPVVEAYMQWKGLVESSIDLFQLSYRTDVVASAGTHGRGGAVDCAQYSPGQIDVWRLFGWPMQRRDLPGVVTHAHGWPLGCDHKSPALQAQEDDWYRGDAGLVGSGRVQGRYPIDTWDVALRRMEAEMAKTLDQMKAEILKEVSGTVAKKVWTWDGIGNIFTANKANKTVTPPTAFVETFKEVAALRQQVSKQQASLDAILAKLNTGVTK